MVSRRPSIGRSPGTAPSPAPAAGPPSAPSPSATGPAPARDPITIEDRAELLALARAALRVATGLEPMSRLGDRLARRTRRAPREGRAAAFVTLTVDGELRGCIGTLEAAAPIGEAVAWAAVNAARRDPRFRPVAAAELPGIRVGISVLGPMVRPTDPLGLLPGVDGVLVEAGARHGLLLPEVATSGGLDARGMLEATCHKAGLPADAWRDPDSRVLLFRTDRFEGPAVDPSDLPDG